MSENKDAPAGNIVCSVCREPATASKPVRKIGADFYVCKKCFQNIQKKLMKDIEDIEGKSLYFSMDFDRRGTLKEINRIGYADACDMAAYLRDKKQRERDDMLRQKEYLTKMDHIPKPHELFEHLNEYIIGQDEAKMVMSVAVYNHYKRLLPYTNDDIHIEKSNILMLGPTGCGKTYMVRTLANFLNVPLSIADATSLTEAGYIGDDVESVLTRLLQQADNDAERAEQGIVFIDEIDKLAKKDNSNQRDVNGEAVQQGLLKLLEGTIIDVPVGKKDMRGLTPTKQLNTQNILFICGGAFSGLENILRKRMTAQGGIGFHAKLRVQDDMEQINMHDVTMEELRQFGLIPEFLGRLPIHCILDRLSTESLIKVLTEPKNAILKQYQKLIDMDGARLEFSENALRAIAAKAEEKQVGARALRAVMEKIMLKVMFDVPKKKTIRKVYIDAEDDSSEITVTYLDTLSQKKGIQYESFRIN